MTRSASGSPSVLEQVVAAAGERRKTLHHLLDDARTGIVEEVRGFARLEERVWILRRSPQDWMVWRQRPATVRVDVLRRQQRAQVVVLDGEDLRHLVRRAKAIEEVQERYARFQRRGVGDGREVLRLLHRR